MIVGHTCNIGGDAYNLTLSKQRAKSVESALAASGIEPSRMKVSWQGMREPLASNDTEEGRAKNRRVEIKIFYTRITSYNVCYTKLLRPRHTP